MHRQGNYSSFGCYRGSSIHLCLGTSHNPSPSTTCSADSSGRALCARRHSRSVLPGECLGGSVPFSTGPLSTCALRNNRLIVSPVSRHLPPPCDSRPVPCTVSLNCSTMLITRRMVSRNSCLQRPSTLLGRNTRPSSLISSTS